MPILINKDLCVLYDERKYGRDMESTDLTYAMLVIKEQDDGNINLSVEIGNQKVSRIGNCMEGAANLTVDQLRNILTVAENVEQELNHKDL